MRAEPVLSESEGGPRRQPIFRLWVIAAALAMAGVVAWVGFYGIAAAEAENNPYDLSRVDGRCRFWATKYSVVTAPANSTLRQRLAVAWINFQKRHGRKNPARWSFGARPVQPCSIHGLLSQCMEITGTRYRVAVEIAGAVEFGHTNALNGGLWVAAFENAIQTSEPVVCYDFAAKRNFQDRLLLIREKPGLVKIVPRRKLAEYQKAGLVRPGSESPASTL